MLSSQSIGNKASQLFQDADEAAPNVRLTVGEIASWINEGCREIVRLKPSALTAVVSMLLVAGSRQTLAGATFKNPLSGEAATVTPVQFLDVVRNMGANGTTPGRAVIGIDRQVLDMALPGWHASAAKSEIRHLIIDPKDPKSALCYPPATANPAVYVEVVLSRLPVNTLDDAATELGSDDIDAGLDDLYETALVDYVLYRKFSEDSETANAQRSLWHYQQFANALGVKFRNEVVLAPKKQFQPQTGEGGA